MILSSALALQGVNLGALVKQTDTKSTQIETT